MTDTTATTVNPKTSDKALEATHKQGRCSIKIDRAGQVGVEDPGIAASSDLRLVRATAWRR